MQTPVTMVEGIRNPYLPSGHAAHGVACPSLYTESTIREKKYSENCPGEHMKAQPELPAAELMAEPQLLLRVLKDFR